MQRLLSQQLSELLSSLRRRGPLRFLLLVCRKAVSPLVYWWAFHIFETDVRLSLPPSYARGDFEIRIYSGSADLETRQAELASMGELQPSEIASRFRRGDVVAVAYAGPRPVGYIWLTFSIGVELTFGVHWVLNSHEALRYGSFVLPDWRGQAIHSFLNHAVNDYARQHGIIRTLASINVLNYRSLSLPQHLQRAPVMTVIVLRLRRLNWTYAKAIGAPLKSRFSKSTADNSHLDKLSGEKNRIRPGRPA
jgi:GNAT superfamily N-acetyltransferase